MKRKMVITQIRSPLNQALLPFACLLENGRLIQALRIEPPNAVSAGDIYIGRVQAVRSDIHAAFIEIAPGLSCFYPLDDAKPIYIRKGSGRDLAQGDELLVQVSRPASKNKRPSVTTELTLTGRYLVLSAADPRLHASSKMKEEDKARLTRMLQSSDCGGYGFILRTNAASADEADILQEMEYLIRRMEYIRGIAKNRICFSCIYKKEPSYLRLLRQMPADTFEEIVTDDPEIYENTRMSIQTYPELSDVTVRLYEDCTLSLSALYNLARELERAVDRYVHLKSGGLLIIDTTEAMTIVDVNSAKSIPGRSSDFYSQINKEAAVELMLQLRLRNISGIIIVDFIDMKKNEQKKELLTLLRQEAKKDPVPVNIVDFTKLDLVEITRKKIEKPLREQLTQN